MRKVKIFEAPRTLKYMLDNTIAKFPNKIAFAFDDKSLTYTYSEIREKCRYFESVFVSHGLTEGSHIAILSQNMPNWGIAYYSITTTSHVAVPLLTELSETEVETILLHADTQAIFVSKKLYGKLSQKVIDNMRLIVCTDDLSIMKSVVDETVGVNVEPNPEDLAVIIYTSGTTGTPKGVMLTHKNLCSNVFSGYNIHAVNSSDVWLSMLPLAHAYECSLSLLLSVFVGGSIFYMSKPPTPQLLMASMKLVRPTVILSVPLVIEKIYKKVKCELNNKLENSFLYRFLYKNCRSVFMMIFGRKIMKLFGGRLEFFGVGGAKLNYEVDQFLHDIKFPYAIGYGLTETSPLLCGASPSHTTVGSTGGAILGVQLKLIDVDEKTGEGQLVAKGDNVMKGYYKNPEATAAAFTEDGWFKTNDLVACREGLYFIRGRINNVVVGASGENIYLEDVESLINANDEVEESLVVMKQGKLTAMIKFKDEIMQSLGSTSSDAKKKLEELSAMIMVKVNNKLNKYSQLSYVVVQYQPFCKTATQKIKRFMYQ